MILVLAFLLALLTSLVTLPALFFRSIRRSALVYTAAALVFIPSFLIGEFSLGRATKRNAISRFVQRSEPLVRAIDAYQREHRRPPAKLEELASNYLAEVPATGILMYHYYEGKEASKFDGNPWVLSVPAPCIGIGFDSLLYFPRQNYPKTGYGGWLERFGSWAYVHE
jgi:hypothetical protein